MSARPHDLEALLREALTPVEPPADLALRLEQALAGITELAHDELEAWEIRTMRDPRNWVRPVVAAAVGVTAGSALVALRVRRSHRRRRAVSRGALDLAERTLRDVRREARRVFS